MHDSNVSTASNLTNVVYPRKILKSSYCYHEWSSSVLLFHVTQPIVQHGFKQTHDVQWVCFGIFTLVSYFVSI